MLFTQSAFFVFFALVFFVYWALRGNQQRKIWLLAASLFFYGCWDWRFLFLLIFSALVDYTVGIGLSRSESPRSRRLWITASVTAQLTILGFFKYFNFFVTSGEGILTWLGFNPGKHTLNIILPVGISFYTFQSMSYTIDVYRGKIKAITSLLDFSLYVAFFPQLVAGPIARASHFLPQLRDKKIFANIAFRSCLGLFLFGFFKKAVIADNVSPIADRIFAAPGSFTQTSLIIGAVFYSIQIYCDFSGYTDMAIAVARMMGYDLAVNFKFPYFSANITDFWRRWHVSLSSWLRDYVYISFGGNRGGALFVYRNLMLTMLLGGLWHGAAWNFVIWGGMHGLALVVHKLLMGRLDSLRGIPARIVSLLAPILTVYWVWLAWIFFRATTFGSAFIVAKGFLFMGANGTQSLDPRLLWWVLPCLILHWISYKKFFAGFFQALPDWAFAACYASAYVAILPFVSYGYKPFIYFQF